jgi:hypothetical protein
MRYVSALRHLVALQSVPALLISLSAAAAAESAPKWDAWLDGGAFYNNRDEKRGESTLWVPFMQSPMSVFFGEVRGKIFEESQREGNFALGYRQMLGNGWNLGAWGGYDVRSTSLGSTFSQMSGGVEALSKNWDLRINGYVPFDESETISSSSISTGGGAPTVLLNGNSILLQTGLYSTTSTLAELALGGFDTEIGMRLPVEALTLDPAQPRAGFQRSLPPKAPIRSLSRRAGTATSRTMPCFNRSKRSWAAPAPSRSTARPPA